jgi:hypothetical protein
MITIVILSQSSIIETSLSILFQLFHAKASTYFGETRDQISRLLTLTVRTGFLTAILAIPIAPLGEILSPAGNLFILPYVVLVSFTAVQVNLNINCDSPACTFLANRMSPPSNSPSRNADCASF